MLTIYGRTKCDYCELAKQYLTELGIPFEYKNVWEDDEAMEFMIQEAHQRFPQIYMNGKLFVEGGNAGLRAMTKDQILKRVQESMA